MIGVLDATVSGFETRTDALLDHSAREGGGSWNCPHQPTHTYGWPGGQKSAIFVGFPAFGIVSVWDANPEDCNNDGIPADWDGDYDMGTTGSFHGYGQWATEPDCDYGLNVHGPTIDVNPSLFSKAAFVTGADETFGPTMIPIDDDADGMHERYICMTDGVIDGDDPTGNDCISPAYITPATGTACGEGGDGGIWTLVFSSWNEADDGSIIINTAGSASSGTITAS